MITSLLLAAVLLGFLAFFEPCTIATHTLFAARTSTVPVRQRWSAMAELLAARALLLISILLLASMINLRDLSMHGMVLVLGGLGAMYLISRKIYIPVPHLEFQRLIPGHRAWPQALQLGLTLPACTLPLVLVLALLAAVTGGLLVAMLAGLLFAILFSLPTFWSVLHGLNQGHRHFLSRIASVTPYLTALILWTGALVLWHTGV